MNNLWCLIGLHKWVYSRIPTLYDIHPPLNRIYIPPTRSCSRCGKAQRWLPGYGGSEDGCWISDVFHKDIEEAKLIACAWNLGWSGYRQSYVYDRYKRRGSNE